MVWFFLFVGVVLIVLVALYRRWRKKIDAELAEGAAVEWTYMLDHEREFVEGLTEEEFNKVYARVHRPRFPGYALAAVATFFAALPIVFVALTLILRGAEQLGVVPAPVDVADRLLIEDGELLFFRDTPPEAALYYLRDLAGFYYFFGVLIVWLFIVWFYMRRYHRRRPGYLRDEIIRERDGA